MNNFFGLSGMPFDLSQAFGKNSILGQMMQPAENVVPQQLPWQAADPANPGPQLPWQRPDYGMSSPQQAQGPMNTLGGLLQAQSLLKSTMSPSGQPQQQAIVSPRPILPSVSPQVQVNSMLAQNRPSARGLLRF